MTSVNQNQQTPQVTDLPEMIAVSGEFNQAANASKLGVMIGTTKLLVNLTDISEVLPVPTIQSVPLTKPWFLGMANVRGSLFAVTDLAQFLSLGQTNQHAGNRIMLLNSVKTTQVALLIDSLLGLRNLETMQLRIDASDKVVSDSISTFHTTHLDCAFVSQQIYLDVDNVAWQTLDIDALVQDKKFIQPSLA